MLQVESELCCMLQRSQALFYIVHDNAESEPNIAKIRTRTKTIIYINFSAAHAMQLNKYNFPESSHVALGMNLCIGVKQAIRDSHEGVEQTPKGLI